MVSRLLAIIKNQPRDTYISRPKKDDIPVQTNNTRERSTGTSMLLGKKMLRIAIATMRKNR
jgi:hypothetical protein